MKIVLYSPYIPKHTGGGEKYMFDVARTLARRYPVAIALAGEHYDIEAITDQYRHFLADDLHQISFIPSPLGTNAPFWKKLAWTKQWDVLYYLTDGSLFFSMAKRNILHIQFPLKLDKSSPMQQLKLKNWQIKNTNSLFTKRVVEQSWPVKIDQVHHPMIDLQEIDQATKGVNKIPVILSVGRFFRHLHSKRQDVLVEMFRQLVKDQLRLMKNWKLVLVGAVEDEEYIREIKQKSRGLAVEFYHDLDRSKLLNWYARASMYWHAAGYGVNQYQYPEKVEHFGISTAEAMAAGCIPIVHGKGGQVEVVGEQLAGCLWQTQQECIDKTVHFIKDDRDRKTAMDLAAEQVNTFNKQRFAKELWQMVEGS